MKTLILSFLLGTTLLATEIDLQENYSAKLKTIEMHSHQKRKLEKNNKILCFIANNSSEDVSINLVADDGLNSISFSALIGAQNKLEITSLDLSDNLTNAPLYLHYIEVNTFDRYFNVPINDLLQGCKTYCIEDGQIVKITKISQSLNFGR